MSSKSYVPNMTPKTRTYLFCMQPLLVSYSNGEILGYQVGYQEASGTSAPSTAPQQVRTVRGRRLEVLLTSLHQFTHY